MNIYNLYLQLDNWFICVTKDFYLSNCFLFSIVSLETSIANRQISEKQVSTENNNIL